MEDFNIFFALPILVSACAFLNLKITPYRTGTTRRKDLNLISFPWICSWTRPLADVDEEAKREVKGSTQFSSRRESWDKKVLKAAKPKISDSQVVRSDSNQNSNSSEIEVEKLLGTCWRCIETTWTAPPCPSIWASTCLTSTWSSDQFRWPGIEVTIHPF